MHVSRTAGWWATRTAEAISVCVFSLVFSVTGEGASSNLVLLNLAVFYFLLLRAICRPDQIVFGRPTYFTIEVLFLIFFFLIFYLPYQQAMLGSFDLSTSQYLVNTYIDGTDKAITLSTVGALSFVLAYRFIAGREKSREDSQRPSMPAWDIPHVTLLSKVTCGSLIALIATYVVAGWRTEGEGRYTDSASGGLAAEGVSLIILMLCLVAIATWLYQKSQGLRPIASSTLALLVAIAWSLRLLSLGDRNSFLLIAIALAAGIFTFWKRASIVVLFVGLAIALVLYNAIEILRVPDLAKTATLLDLIGLGERAGGDEGESSFNITTVTLRAAVEAVPEHYGYSYGVYKVVGVLGIIPFFRGVYATFFSPEHFTSAEFLGDIMLGPNASWNVGSNVIADSYLEFGLIGVIVLLGAVGGIAAMLRNRVVSQPQDLARFVVYVVAIGLFAELPRYSLDFPIRVLVWTAVLLGVTFVFSRRRHRPIPLAPQLAVAQT